MPRDLFYQVDCKVFRAVCEWGLQQGPCPEIVVETDSAGLQQGLCAVVKLSAAQIH